MKVAHADHYNKPFTTNIPARLDRLPWARFHWLVMCALGVTWILDGLEVTLTGTFSGVLQDPATLHFTPAMVGALGSAYVIGAVVGSLFFGYLTELWGRKKLFFLTLSVYVMGVILSAFSWNLGVFMLFRFITGLGIGGEYAAINSAVDEMVPARLRGRINLIINGSYWGGAALGSLSTIWLLDPRLFAVDHGWRFGFLIGGVLGLSVLLLRRVVPESPRWLVLHGYRNEAERVVKDIENQVKETTSHVLSPLPHSAGIRLSPRKDSLTFKVIFNTMVHKYRRSSMVGMCLMTAQAFLYNAIFFTYASVLTKFYDVPAKDTGLYLLPFAVGNLLGPLVLGHLFDAYGRRKMITITYLASGVLLAITGYLFAHNLLSAQTQTIMWSVIFFFASAAASSAYLTVSEIFPMETRPIAIAIFFSLGTGVGGALAPWLFGTLIGTGSHYAIFYGYLFAGILMIAAGLVEWFMGIECAGRSLEDIAKPLAAEPFLPVP